MKLISSLQNPVIKHLVQLQEKAKVRRQNQQFLIEGQREIELALLGGYTLQQLFFLPEVFDVAQLEKYDLAEVELIEITAEVYQKIAYRDTTEGVLAVAQTRSLELNQLQLGENPLILIAESPEKPGNIGALLRTADAANIDAVIIADPKTDLYNPNIVRSSVGGLFTVQVATGSTPEILAYLQQHSIAIYSAALQDSVAYTDQDFTGPTALVVGTEATGLTAAWREQATQVIRIPMEGQLDSMNVSVAAAILVFEAKRQRITQA